MWKKNTISVIIISLIVSLFSGFHSTDAASPSKLEKVQANSYALIDLHTGAILIHNKESDANPPASITKVMTEYLVLEAIEEREIGWNERVKISGRVEAMDEAQVFLREGDQPTVRQLFTAMAVYSANDAAVALAEHISTTETNFVQRMNKKARALGLENTHFTNCTGLPKESYLTYPKVKGEHKMSALDIAMLTRRLLLDYPEVIRTTSITEFTFGESGHQQRFKNWNLMLPGFSYAYEGVDGVKTGFTSEAGYNFVGSVQQDKMRLISVVMGTNSRTARFSETKKLLDYGFDNFRQKTWVTKNHALEQKNQVKVKDGVETIVTVVPQQSLSFPSYHHKLDHYQYDVQFTKPLVAPIKAGTVVGTVKILYDKKEIPGVTPIPLVTREDVDKAGWWRLLFRSLFGED